MGDRIAGEFEIPETDIAGMSSKDLLDEYIFMYVKVWLEPISRDHSELEKAFRREILKRMGQLNGNV